MQYELQVASDGVTDVGKVRSKNEDSILILEDQLVYCVADGMGGVSGGDVASQRVVSCIREQLTAVSPSIPLKERILTIHQAVMRANEWILGWSEQNAVQGAGTTLVLLVLSEEYPWAVNILHAGDSRAYRFRKAQLEQITADHSLEEAVGDNSGQPLPSQFRGLITNAVGLKKSLSLDLTHAEQMPGDIWLLCSDGLNKMLSDDTIASMLAEGGDADTLTRRLVDAANAAGGKDNVSVVVVKVQECSERSMGVDAVPFPGPLPNPPQEEETTTDTTMTAALSMDSETNGSVMVSLDTTNSETDFLSHEGGDGIPKKLRWLLITLCAAIILYVIWTLALGRATPGQSKSSPFVEAQAPAKANSVQPSAEQSVSIQTVIETAELTGHWQTAYAIIQRDTSSSADRLSRNESIINAWYTQVWEEAEQDPLSAVKTMPILTSAANEVITSINGNRLSVSDSWPEESAAIASEFCRRRYNLQQMLSKELHGFWVHSSRRISFMRGLSDEQVEALFQATTSDEQSYKDYTQCLQEAERAAKGLSIWLKDRVQFPLAQTQIEALSGTYIQSCDKADDAIEKLAVALRVMPEFQDGTAVASDSDLGMKLSRAQSKWKSIQKVLINLESGELSAGGERAIRQYIESLYLLEKATAQQ